MDAPLLFYLPEPVGWIGLTPEALREAQLRAGESIGVERSSDERDRRAERTDCVSAEEAARALGIDASWLLKRARERRVPFLMVGKYRRFDIEQLRAHFAKEPTK